LLTDFAAAEAFIEADGYMINGFFLAAYAVNEDRNIFWFDLYVNDYPLPHDSSHFIEVVVERGTVLRYRKCVYNYFGDS
jgi:hypothetical protein